MKRPKARALIVADTSATVALVDASDRHHASLRSVFEADPGAWVIPCATLPEIDSLLGSHVGRDAQDAFFADVADGAYRIEQASPEDAVRAFALHERYGALRLGLVDGVVLATAERLRATAVATLDLRHFGAVALPSRPRLVPRDL